MNLVAFLSTKLYLHLKIAQNRQRRALELALLSSSGVRTAIILVGDAFLSYSAAGSV